MKSVAAMLFVITSVSFSVSMAEETPSTYNFGGACRSQGTWTQDALAGTDALLRVATQLKNDPKCGTLAKTLEMQLNTLRASVDSINVDAAPANRLSILKDQTLGLRKFAYADGPMKKKVIDLILNNTIESAMTASETTGAGSMATALVSTGKRINRATRSGFDILEKVMDSALEEQTCLSSPNTAGPFLSSMIEVTSAFAGSGQDSFGSRMARLVNQISRLMRDGKYANVMKQLNQTQLRNSISCLMEVSSTSYCSVLDAEALRQDRMKSLVLTSNAKNEIVLDEKVGGSGKDGPLEGYYILSQQVPRITEWLEKVQLGVEPKLKTDGANKNDILATAANFAYTENDLLANFNQAKANVKGIDSLEGKKNLVFKTLMQISDRLANNINTSVDNFYTVSVRPQEIPFRLLGHAVPPEVLGKGATGIFQTPADWIGANIPLLVEFNNPEQLMNTIDGNLRQLIENSRKNVNSYYNKWFLYDQAALVVDSMTGLKYNVPEALLSVSRYLTHLEEKIKGNSGFDGSTLHMIGDTREKIQHVLEKYDSLRALGEEFKQAQSKDQKTALIRKGQEISKDLIEVVYDEFNVQKGKSLFLENRISILVKKDFETMMDVQKDFTSDTVRKILHATGEAAFDRMREMSSGNPTDVSMDLANAQVRQLENLQSVEMLFRDNFLATIAYTKMVAENRTPDDNDVRRDSFQRAVRDYREEYPFMSRHLPGLVMEAVIKPLDFYFSYYKGNSNRYPRTVGTSFGSNKVASHFDTENRSAQQMYEFYCIQSLAFSDWRPFKPLCKSVVLKSPFITSNLSKQAQALFDQTLNVSYDATLSSNLNAEAFARYKNLTDDLKYANLSKLTAKQKDDRALLARQLSLNQSARICALHNYSINNQVMHLTLGKQKE